jgi:hypothetical protein
MAQLPLYREHSKLARILTAFALLLSGPFASAKEGFYRIDQFPDQRDLLESARSAVVLFEMRGDDGRWNRFANGFFVSASGHVLTNHHVGINCGGRAPDDRYRDHSKPWELEAGRGYPCRDFRAVVRPDGSRERIVELELLARPDQATIDRGGDFILLHAIDYRPEAYVKLANTRNFPRGTPLLMPGYPPETFRGDSSVLIRQGIYEDVARRGEYRIATGRIVAPPPDYLHASNPEPYFVGDADGAPGTSGSLIVTPEGNFLGFVQGGADPVAMGNSPKCLRDGRQVGPVDRWCGGLINYLRATWVLDRMSELFPGTMRGLLRRR